MSDRARSNEGREIAQEVAMASTLQRVLELWRASERELAEKDPDGRDRSQVSAQIERLRRLYQRVATHEQRELGAYKGPDRTIVRAEWLAVRSRASSESAEAAVQRARTARRTAGSTSGQPDEAAANPS
jgi:hypothetical protein